MLNKAGDSSFKEYLFLVELHKINELAVGMGIASSASGWHDIAGQGRRGHPWEQPM